MVGLMGHPALRAKIVEDHRFESELISHLKGAGALHHLARIAHACTVANGDGFSTGIP